MINIALSETSIALCLYDWTSHQRHTQIAMERLFDGTRSRLLHPYLYRENRDRGDTTHQSRGIGTLR